MEFWKKVVRKLKEGYLRQVWQEVLWLRQYVVRYRLTILIHIVLGIVGILMGLGTSVASKYLIDAVTGYETGRIGTAAAAMVGMLLGNILMKGIAARIGAVLNVRVQNEIQAEVYEKVLRSDWESLKPFGSGDLMQRLMQDVGTVGGGITGFLPGLISSLVQFFGALLIMLYYDPTMACIALLGVPVAVLSSRVLLGKMHTHSRKMKDLNGDVMSFYEDSINNLTSIKAFDITADFYDKMTDLQHKYRDEYLTYNLFTVRTGAFISLLGMIVSAACFGWGVYRLWAGKISFGSMTMFLQLASTLSSSFSALIGMASKAISLATSAGRVMEVTELPMEDTGSRDFRQEQDLGLHIEKACFSYEDGREVLHKVEFEAGVGDLVALTGPSGEGKTTMLRLILGLIRPGEGKAVLRCGGEELPLSAATRSAFAYVPQGNSMFAGTIRSNLLLTRPQAAEEELWQVLNIACASDFVRQLPDGLGHVVGGRGKGLSEGQAQRLAIARALLRGAPILLLDEATSALDEETEQKLLENLMDSGLVKTCIFVTHRPGTMHFCTRQYALSEGWVRIDN